MINKYLKFSVVNVFLILTTFTSCSEEEVAPEQMPPQEYPVSQISSTTVSSYVSYPTAIEGLQVVELRPKIQGYIEEILVNEGDAVKKGQLLFKINAAEYGQQVLSAKASVAVAESKVELAKVEVDKQKPLVEKGIVSDFILQKAILDLKSAEASLQEAKAFLQNAQTNWDYCNIKSPIDGVIGMIPFHIGSLVSSSISEPLASVTNIKDVRAYFSVNEKDYISLSKEIKHAADSNNINLLLADGTLYSQKGTIDAISGLIETGTGSVTLRAAFSNPDGVLLSGASGIIQIPLTLDNVILVPQAATFEIQNKRFIYVVNNEDIVAPVEIEAIEADNGKDFIVKSGLEPGSTIVLSGINSLAKDMKIIPVSQNNTK